MRRTRAGVPLKSATAGAAATAAGATRSEPASEHAATPSASKQAALVRNINRRLETKLTCTFLLKKRGLTPTRRRPQPSPARASAAYAQSQARSLPFDAEIRRIQRLFYLIRMLAQLRGGTIGNTGLAV